MKDNFSGFVKCQIILFRNYINRTQTHIALPSQVRGYKSSSAETRYSMMDVNIEQETIRELSQRRHTLLLELKNYEENQRMGSSGEIVYGKPSTAGDQVGIIPVRF